MRKAAAWVAGAVLAAALAGCGGKFTRVRYELVQIGMDRQEVRNILGAPAETTVESWTYARSMPYSRAVITFTDGRVSDRSWSDERPGPASQPQGELEKLKGSEPR